MYLVTTHLPYEHPLEYGETLNDVKRYITEVCNRNNISFQKLKFELGNLFEVSEIDHGGDPIGMEGTRGFSTHYKEPICRKCKWDKTGAFQCNLCKMNEYHQNNNFCEK
jgi:hypothetical protein